MMVYENRNITVSKSARYWLGGDLTGKAETLIMVLHGYGMAARDCLEKFSGLEGPGILMVAPEGLSRFYRKGFDGEVVASWMTREDRVNEISDQSGYLNRLLHEIRSVQAPAIRKVIVAGYSQGTATAARWISGRKGEGIEGFIVVAGDVPPDILESGWPAVVKVIQVYSETDEFIPSAKFHAQAAKLQALQVNLDRLAYYGGHAILPETVIRLKDMI